MSDAVEAVHGPAALFVLGFRKDSGSLEPAISAVTFLGESLLASEQSWRLRRLAPLEGDRSSPTRPNVRREVDLLMSRPASLRLLVLAGEVTRTVEGFGFVCSSGDDGFIEDTTVPLEWIGDRMRRTPATPTIVILVANSSSRAPSHWYELLESRSPQHVAFVALDMSADVLASIAGVLARPGLQLAELPVELGLAVPAAMRSADSDNEPPDPLVGTELPGRFKIEGKLGAGRFGAVYRARHLLVDRQVAIKIAPPFATSDSAAAFQEEIRVVARLDHPNIVRVHHAETTSDGRPFVAMELVRGPSLRTLLQREGALPAIRAVQIARDLCAGLAVAHEQGVVHSDVNPGNVMLTEPSGGRAVLVDFGLARLTSHPSNTSRGGSPGYLAPEQLRAGQVSPASDLYSLGVVLLAMIRGVDHEAGRLVGAGIEAVPDEALRAILGRALAVDPRDRFATANELDASLSSYLAVSGSRARTPFRIAAPFTENDAPDFHGRAGEVTALLEQVLFRRGVVYVAPSGTGKTSLLRAGLGPRLRQLGIQVLYVQCRATTSHSIAGQIAVGATSVPEAVTQARSRIVIILDQVEADLMWPQGADRVSILDALRMPEWPAECNASVVFSVREEYLAGLLSKLHRVDPSIPVIRLAPLSPAVAREVFTTTLAARGLRADPALLEVLFADLARAAGRLATEQGWLANATVYPPHLQLAGSVIVDALPVGAATITLAHYEALGGFDTIIAEHLHHVLEAELDAERTTTARQVLLAFVASHSRATLDESELVRSIGHGKSADAVSEVLSFLRDRGLLVAFTGPNDTTRWDLAHDSLVARIQDWITRTDLARLRAIELVRYHLRRGGHRDSLLDRGELREIRTHLQSADLALLDEEWRRGGESGRPASDLVAASRGALVRRRVAVASVALLAVSTAAFLGNKYMNERSLRLREAVNRDRDLGQSVIVVSEYDWNPTTLQWTPASRDPALSWEWFRPASGDEDAPGDRFAAGDIQRVTQSSDAGEQAEILIARGGAAVVVVHRSEPPGGPPCADSIIPVRHLPGYVENGQRTRIVLRVPTCAATRADMVEIPAGPFIAGGRGDPPAPWDERNVAPEMRVEMPTYWLDRTEVTAGAFRGFLAMSNLHGFSEQPKPPSVDDGTPAHPASAITWREARAFCRYLGKDLPTLDQWDKALRGGTSLGDAPNPCPNRSYAWCGDLRPGDANVTRGLESSPAPVGTFPRDTSPYGVVDLVGNVYEWTRSPALPYQSYSAAELASKRALLQKEVHPLVITRGCNWADVECESSPLLMMPIPNPRLRDVRYYTLGLRCAIAPQQS